MSYKIDNGWYPTNHKYYWPSGITLHFNPKDKILYPSPYLAPSFYDAILHPFKMADPRSYKDKIYSLTKKESKELSDDLSFVYEFHHECDIRLTPSGNYSMRPSSCERLMQVINDYGLSQAVH